MLEEKYKEAAKIIVKAGFLPFPISDTLIEILKHKTDESELDLIKAFKRRKSQTLEQLIKSSKMSEDEILKKADSLANKGLLFKQPNSQGIIVYRILPIIVVGLFEYTFMNKLKFSEEEQKFANLFAKLIGEVKDLINEKYDVFEPIFKKLPPLDRTIPLLDRTIDGKEVQIKIDKDVLIPEERILPSFKIEEIINKFDDIAVGHCFCRQHKDLIGVPCKVTDLRENCFIFGKSARFVIEQGFARKVSKEESLDLMKKSEEAGLVHKAFHPHSDIFRDEDSICNCCGDCCINYEFWRAGALPIINSTNYLSKVNDDLCIGCGTCVEKCPVQSIMLTDGNLAKVQDERCIGCGICAHFCPEGAISLLEGMRKVFFPPLK